MHHPDHPHRRDDGHVIGGGGDLQDGLRAEDFWYDGYRTNQFG